MEAELAGLRPREDRLDRERLIFRAGQASVAGRQAGIVRWAWPAVSAGMTAAAATLLVMLLVRPEPRERIRIVEVQVPARPADAGPTRDGRGRESDLPLPPGSDAQPLAEALVSYHAGLLPGSQWGASRSRAGYLEMCDWMLAQGADPWARPVTPPTAPVEPGPGPLPYRRWLKNLLEDDDREALPSDWLDIPLERGANS